MFPEVASDNPLIATFDTIPEPKTVAEARKLEAQLLMINAVTSGIEPGTAMADAETQTGVAPGGMLLPPDELAALTRVRAFTEAHAATIASLYDGPLARSRLAGADDDVRGLFCLDEASLLERELAAWDTSRREAAEKKRLDVPR